MNSLSTVFGAYDFRSRTIRQQCRKVNVSKRQARSKNRPPQETTGRWGIFFTGRQCSFFEELPHPLWVRLPCKRQLAKYSTT